MRVERARGQPPGRSQRPPDFSAHCSVAGRPTGVASCSSSSSCACDRRAASAVLRGAADAHSSLRSLPDACKIYLGTSSVAQVLAVCKCVRCEM